MTSPGEGQQINLATLWIPVLPETSRLGEGLREAGRTGRQAFEEGFGSGEGFANSFSQGLQRGFAQSNMSGMFEPLMRNIGSGQAMMIGAVAGATTEALNLVGKGVESIMGVVERGVEAASEEMMHLIETFDMIDRQLTLYTSAQGDALEQIGQDAREVFKRMDADAGDLGKTLGTLRQQFQLNDEQLKTLTYHMLELGERFGGLNVQQVSAAMHQFNIVGEEVDKSLATLVGDAREAGVSLQGLTQSMVTVGPLLQDMGVSFNAAALGLSKIQQLGDPAQRVIVGLAHAAGEMGKYGNDPGSLKNYINDVIEAFDQMAARGQKGDIEEQGSKLFGVRNYQIILQVLGQIKEMLHGVGDEGNNINLDNLIDQSTVLENHFKRLRHDIEGTFAPIADIAAQSMEHGLDNMREAFDRNEEKIVAKIKAIGDEFIQALPGIQKFVVEFLAVLAPMAQGVAVITGDMISSFAAFMQMLTPVVDLIAKMPDGLAKMIPGGEELKDFAKSWEGVTKSVYAFGDKIANIKIGQGINELKDFIGKQTIDVPGLTHKWDDYWESVGDKYKKSEQLEKLQALLNTQALKMNEPLGDSGPGGMDSFGGGSDGPLHVGGSGYGSGGGHTNSGVYSGGGQPWLAGRLKQAGLSEDEIKGLLAVNQVEGGATNPSSTLGLTDGQMDQFGLPRTAEGHVQAFLGKQWDDPSRRGPDGAIPGVTKDGRVTDWDAYMTWLRVKILGQNGSPSDWQGNQQPSADDYQSRLMGALGSTSPTDYMSGPGPSIFRNVDSRGSSSGGGPGQHVSAGGQAVDQFAQSQSGKPYKWGGYGDKEHGGLYDCSGFMSSLYGVMTGKAMPGDVRFFTTTSDFEALGFVPENEPHPGTFEIGVSQEHMAGTLPSGVNVESGGAADKTQYGGSAAGAWSSQFSQHYYLPNGSDGGPAGPQVYLADSHTPGGGGEGGGHHGEGADPMKGHGMPRGGGEHSAPGYDPDKIDEQKVRRQRALEDANDAIKRADQQEQEAEQRAADAKKVYDQAKAQWDRDFAALSDANQLKQQAKQQLDKLERTSQSADLSLQEAQTAQRRSREDLQIAGDQANEPIKTGGGKGNFGQEGFGLSEQLGRGLLSGAMSDLGFGNVFAKPPNEWGITKLLGGLGGWGLNTANAWGDMLSGQKTGETVSLGGGPGVPNPFLPNMKGPLGKLFPGGPTGTLPGAGGHPQIPPIPPRLLNPDGKPNMGGAPPGSVPKGSDPESLIRQGIVPAHPGIPAGPTPTPAPGHGPGPGFPPGSTIKPPAPGEQFTPNIPQPRVMHTGGWAGDGHAILKGGEFVVNDRSAARFAPELMAMNSYDVGGEVTPQPFNPLQLFNQQPGHYTSHPMSAPLVAAGAGASASALAGGMNAGWNLWKSQDAVNRSAAQSYVAGAGHGVNLGHAQGLFDARANMDIQNRIMADVSGARTELGQRPLFNSIQSPYGGFGPLNVRGVPDNDRYGGGNAWQRSFNALSSGSYGFIPNVPRDLHTAMNWGSSSSADHWEAGLDAASFIPIPGMGMLSRFGSRALRSMRGIGSGVEAASSLPGHGPVLDYPGSELRAAGRAGKSDFDDPFKNFANGPWPTTREAAYQPRFGGATSAPRVNVSGVDELRNSLLPPLFDPEAMRGVSYDSRSASQRFNNAFGESWINANIFPAIRDTVQRHAVDAVRNPGLQKFVEPQRLATTLNAFMRDAENGRLGMLYSAASGGNTREMYDEMLQHPRMQEAMQALGYEIASRSAYSSPTEQMLYRGSKLPLDRTFNPGEVLNLSPRSFSESQINALMQAQNVDKSTLKWQQREALAKAGFNPTVYNLLPGAHVADLGHSIEDPFTGKSTPWDEQLAMGQFRVHGVENVDLGVGGFRPYRNVFLQQTGINPAGYDQGGAVYAKLHEGEHVFTRQDVQAMGGQEAVYQFRSGLSNPFAGFDAGGHVNLASASNIKSGQPVSMSDFMMHKAMGNLGSAIGGLGGLYNSDAQHAYSQPGQVTYDQSINISGNTIADPQGLKQSVQEQMMQRFYAQSGSLPAGGPGSP